jgi:hypothetical protein
MIYQISKISKMDNNIQYPDSFARQGNRLLKRAFKGELV